MWQAVKNTYHLLMAILANIYYGFPGKKLTIIGVTGTDGKTTTVNMIYHILKGAGLSVSMISTVGAVIHGKPSEIGFHVTNPTSFPLQRFLRQAVSKGDRYLVLEVTSHGLDQKRVWGIPFTVGVLTNITHEHLDYHKTYTRYVQTKVKLLNRSKVAIVNRDDHSYHKLKYFLMPGKKIVTYGSKKDDITFTDFHIPATIQEPYNRYNALAASIAAQTVGVDKKTIEKALKTFVFPKGRVEIVYKKDFTVMIDFAHTPNAFEQLLSSIRTKTKGNLIHVFGSASKRDESKRPLMGEVASKYDDSIVLTSEDPRKESPEKIMKEIEEGFISSRKVSVYKIADRKEAIQKAISLAKKGDVVVCTGKGHEKSMNYGKDEEPWDEFAAVEEALKNKQIIQETDNPI